MIKQFSLFFFHLVFLASLSAHPSWGIVVDPDENIYFVDVMHNGDGTLWRIAPHYQKLEAVFTKFHAHQMIMDQSGQIWIAQAIWRSGEIEGEGYNFLYRFSPETNNLDTVVFTEDWDEFYGGSFTMSADSRSAYFQMNEQVQVKPLEGGKTHPLLNHKFGRINTLATGPDGTLWITDKRHKGGTLFRWSSTTGLEEYATELLPDNPADPIFEEERHQLLYGIGFSVSGNPLITDNSQRCIQEILPGNKKKRVFQSEKNWHPVGVYERNERYYVMETGWSKKGHLGPRISILNASFQLEKRLEIEFFPFSPKSEGEPGRIQLVHPTKKQSKGQTAPTSINSSGRSIQQDSLPPCEWCGALEAPENVRWKTRLASPDEPGEPLFISGTVFLPDGTTPARDVILYVYHTNTKGIYEKKGNEKGNGQRHGHLRGWMKTDNQGRYAFKTIRPAPYPSRNEPAHIHITYLQPGGKENWLYSFLFKGDPLISKKDKKTDDRTGGFSNIISLQKDQEGVWVGSRNLILPE
jgi:protocatechuate 3,4-dioxygenase beta subunit